MRKNIINISEVELQPRPLQIAPTGDRFPIRAGDVIACPPGGPETAHQIVNSGGSELRYLAVSTMETPEVCEYPDSGKIGVLGEGMRAVWRADQQAGYWEGE